MSAPLLRPVAREAAGLPASRRSRRQMSAAGRRCPIRSRRIGPTRPRAPTDNRAAAGHEKARAKRAFSML
ncbi:hypothetical protein [Solimonas variicoloris]|uniref:hypothetical protein n=1 Tax=Solimonas variicoloris TaxID=254408 RepID=UPI00037BD3EE|nr:hypothetical protein [Solimonas variicoloris]